MYTYGDLARHAAQQCGIPYHRRNEVKEPKDTLRKFDLGEVIVCLDVERRKCARRRVLDDCQNQDCATEDGNRNGRCHPSVRLESIKAVVQVRAALGQSEWECAYWYTIQVMI